MRIAVIFFCYLRPEKFEQTLVSISKNRELNKYHFIARQDGLRDTKDTDDHASIEKCWGQFVTNNKIKSAEFICSKNNLGLRRSIMEGVTDTLLRFDAVVVVEDDLEVHPSFLTMMETLLTQYQNDDNISHVNAWAPPFLKPKPLTTLVTTQMMFCWGWGTWSHKWQKFAASEDFGRKNTTSFQAIKGNFLGLAGFRRQLKLNDTKHIKTWAVYWYWYLFQNKKMCVGPNQSLVRNTGNDGSGQNCGDISSLNQLAYIFDGRIQFTDRLQLPKYQTNKKFAVRIYYWLIIRNTISILRKFRLFK